MNALTKIPLIGPDHAGRILSTGWQNALGGKIAVTDKATGEVLFESGLANAADVTAAAKSARLAQAAWAATPGPLRGDVIRKFASLVEANAEVILVHQGAQLLRVLPRHVLNREAACVHTLHPFPIDGVGAGRVFAVGDRGEHKPIANEAVVIRKTYG